jgi:hypothetical protein
MLLAKSALKRSMIAPENPCQGPSPAALFRNERQVWVDATDSAQIAPVPQRPTFVKNQAR